MQAQPHAALVEDETQLSALASTVRQDIVDTLRALGEASAPELAAHLNRPADGLYYHLRALSRVGLVAEVCERRKGRVAEAVYSLRQKTLALSHRPRDQRAKAALINIVRAMFSGAEREYRRAIADQDCVVDGPRRELWPSRVVGWLTPHQLEQVNTLLSELNALVATNRFAPEARLYALQFSLAPAAPRPTSHPKPK
jgi:DNA-binding transcriptional ArsR family regulator